MTVPDIISARSAFFSDWHLGTQGANPRELLSVLRRLDVERLYLVGDIFDLSHGGPVYWTRDDDRVIAQLRRMARDGVDVIYLTGNHDRDLAPVLQGFDPGFQCLDETFHETEDGRQFLIIHGDCLDDRIFRFKFMSRAGSRIDGAFRALDNIIGRGFSRPITLFEGLSRAFRFLRRMTGDYEGRALSYAAAHGFDGIICGHSHTPALNTYEDATFGNCGDWIDSRSMLIERPDGALMLLDLRASHDEATQAPETPILSGAAKC